MDESPHPSTAFLEKSPSGAAACRRRPHPQRALNPFALSRRADGRASAAAGRSGRSRPLARAARTGLRRAGEGGRDLALGQPVCSASSIAWTSTFLVIRLLNPADYGLVAMTGVVLTFLDLFKGWGFASSLVRDEQDRHAQDRPGLRAC